MQKCIRKLNHPIVVIHVDSIFLLLYSQSGFYTVHSISIYSRVWNKRTPTLINLLAIFQGLRPYTGLHRAYLSSIIIRYKWGYAYSFCQIFQGLCLFKGVHLFQTLEYPAKSEFFVRLQIFLLDGFNFLPSEEIPSHAKNDVCGYQ